jgi:hypothetical protein
LRGARALEEILKRLNLARRNFSNPYLVSPFCDYIVHLAGWWHPHFSYDPTQRTGLRPVLYEMKVEKTLKIFQSFRNVAKMWFFTKRGFVRKRPFRDGAETRPKPTNCGQKAAGKACIYRIDEGMRQHPSRISHSFPLCTAAVTGRRRRCKYAPSVHHSIQPVLILEHLYAFEPLFSIAGHF